MKKILLIYGGDYGKDVDIITNRLTEDDNKVYHFPEETAIDFLKEIKDISKIYFTNNISNEGKLLFLKDPYNGTEIG